MRLPRVGLVLVLAASVAAPGAARAAQPLSPLCIPRTAPPAVGTLAVTNTLPLPGGRTVELTVNSPAMGGSVRVLVMTPDGYSSKPSRRYPVLYLLHGHGGRGPYDWVNHDVDDLVNDPSHPMIVIMPDGGYDGFYSDWLGVDVDGHHGTDGNAAPAWETFHIQELITFVDANWRTIATPAARAVAGVSMGGYGAMVYAARHPDLFAAAGSFSGAVDPRLDWPVGPLVTPVAANLPDQKPPDECIWGDPLLQDDVWRAHNPTDLAANLAGLSLFVASGNGVPGMTDQINPATSLTEVGVRQMNEQFDAVLTANGISHTTDFRDHGVHSWTYWEFDLKHFVAQLATLPAFG